VLLLRSLGNHLSCFSLLRLLPRRDHLLFDGSESDVLNDDGSIDLFDSEEIRTSDFSRLKSNVAVPATSYTVVDSDENAFDLVLLIADFVEA